MEKTVVKTAVYTLISSFFILFAVIPRESMITDFDGYSSYEVTAYADYFFMIALYSVRITLIGVLGTIALLYMLKYDKNREQS
ncbi:hypothetical protein DV702_08520 [Sporosarcina sp. PTS2304]|uniref:hypothetical protein n=1 Tax=Sporosarcina sp. PTS2304 TaxID=2283194 RepID=UPI000E0D195B|nr:hypothetical protein [Sporosarcina sp. PTS2304]AXH99771.1 hypothetical protein DV702_08520 [Sporosarcina sp. PTS2304]